MGRAILGVITNVCLNITAEAVDGRKSGGCRYKGVRVADLPRVALLSPDFGDESEITGVRSRGTILTQPASYSDHDGMSYVCNTLSWVPFAVFECGALVLVSVSILSIRYKTVYLDSCGVFMTAMALV